jgi:hypothetical protein
LPCFAGARKPAWLWPARRPETRGTAARDRGRLHKVPGSRPENPGGGQRVVPAIRTAGLPLDPPSSPGARGCSRPAGPHR